MRITTWNVRGLNAPNKQCMFKRNLTFLKSELIIIQKNQVNNEEGERLSKQLGLWKSEWVDLEGALGGLSIIWDPRKMDYTNIKAHKIWMERKIKSYKNDTHCIIINVYGPNQPSDK